MAKGLHVATLARGALSNPLRFRACYVLSAGLFILPISVKTLRQTAHASELPHKLCLKNRPFVHLKYSYGGKKTLIHPFQLQNPLYFVGVRLDLVTKTSLGLFKGRGCDAV